jgi:putative membrane protein
MQKRILFLTALAATALAVACQAAAQTSPQSHAAGAGSVDQTFVTHAAADGSAEVALGQLALQKSSSTQTKQLAQHIVDDHTKANDQLVALARQKQITVTPEPDAAAKQKMEKLQQLNGDAFDRAYAQAMVKDHEKAIQLFTKASTGAKDADLRQFATQTLPVLKNHLQMARELRQDSHSNGQPASNPPGTMQETPRTSPPSNTPPTTTGAPGRTGG